MIWELVAFHHHFTAGGRRGDVMEDLATLRDLGYAGSILSVRRGDEADWALAARWAELGAVHGLTRPGCYTVLDPHEPAEGARSAAALVELLPAGATLDVALSLGWQVAVSDPTRDDAARVALAPVAARAAARGVRLSLYPHFGFWLERGSDARRLLAGWNGAPVGISFCGFHWQVTGGGELGAELAALGPELGAVNVSGSRRDAAAGPGAWPRRIAPVGEGDFPLRACVAALAQCGWRGPVSFQGYGLPGEPRDNLRRSRDAWRAAEAELATAAPIERL